MVRNSTTSNNGVTYKRYICSTYKKFGKQGCDSHLIREDRIYNIVLKSINVMIDNLCDMEEAIKGKITLKKKNTIAQHTSELNASKSAIEQLETNTSNLNMNYNAGILDSDEYEYNKKCYDDQIELHKEKVKSLNEGINTLYNFELTGDAHVDIVKSYKGIKDLDRHLVIKLIDKIIINKNIEVSIKFKFKDAIERSISNINI